MERGFEVRYVGKAYNANDRFRNHLKENKKNRKGTWIKSLKKIGMKPELEILEIFCGAHDEEWQNAERWWISYMRSIGCRLTNIEEGGRGGRHISMDAKRRLSILNKGKKRPPFTAEHRARLSAAGKNQPGRAEHNKRVWTGRKHSAETKAKFSEIARNRPPMSAKHRAKIAAKLTGRPCSAETRAKISSSGKGKIRSPEYRARMSAAKRGKPGHKISAENKAKLLAARWPKSRFVSSKNLETFSSFHP